MRYCQIFHNGKMMASCTQAHHTRLVAFGAITDVIMSYFPKACIQTFATSHLVWTAIHSYLQDLVTLTELRQLVQTVTGTTHPIDELQKIIETAPESSETITNAPVSAERRNRQWSIAEDRRLLAGILRNGIENWTAVSQFMGTGRSRSQCSQRWHRGLNPRISKDKWTDEEEQKLVSLVRQFGDASWTRIASKMGNRSDVQCRYRYRQILKESAETNFGTRDSQATKESVPADGIVLPISPNVIGRQCGVSILPASFDAEMYCVY